MKNNFNLTKNMDLYTVKLKEILVEGSNKYDILNCKTLKEAHIYCKCKKLSGQLSGILIEKYKLIKNNPSDNNGDFKHKNENVEFKMSNGGKNHNKFNFVQIRIHSNCNYLLSAYYIDYTNLDILGELFIFKINKQNMKILILKYGCYAHGTKCKNGEINESNLSGEYALRPKKDDNLWNELLRFRIHESDI